MQRIKFELLEKDVHKIRSVCDIKDADYMNIMCTNNTLQFIAYNNEVFKILQIAQEDLADFQIRVNTSSFLSVLASGVYVLEITDNTVSIARFISHADLASAQYKMIVRLPYQKEIDSYLNKILFTEERRRIEKPFAVSNFSHISTLQSFARISNGGVALYNGLLYTSGNGFKAFTDISCKEVNFGLTTEGLTQITKYSKYFNKAFTDMWDIDNYVLMNFDNITLGINKCRLKSFNELNGLGRLKVLASVQVDFDEFSNFIKSIKTTKDSDAIITLDTQKEILKVTDRLYGTFCIKLYAQQSRLVEHQKVTMSMNILKQTFPNLKSKSGDTVLVEIFDSVVSFANPDGIRLLVVREG